MSMCIVLQVDCEPPAIVSENQIPGPLEEHYIFLTTETSLHPNFCSDVFAWLYAF